MGSVYAKSSKQVDLKPNEIGRAQALDTAMAVIEFSPDGLIRYANDNFLNATGYRLDEIVGKHHRIFCEPEYAASQEYFLFWKHLAAGRTNAGTFKRNRKDGSAIYIEASYIPVKSLDGAVVEVIKIAQDVTEKTLRTMGVKAKSDQAHELSQQASVQATENFGLIQSLAGHVQSGIKDVEDLGTLAKRIGGITQVISDIAMQTNLLSLNAAIEAAHAGTSGRGFAVVAAEVRLLATKSASQALEIEEMIVETQHGVHAVADKMKKCSVQSEQAMVQTQGAINSLNQLGVIAHELNGLVQSLK